METISDPNYFQLDFESWLRYCRNVTKEFAEDMCNPDNGGELQDKQLIYETELNLMTLYAYELKHSHKITVFHIGSNPIIKRIVNVEPGVRYLLFCMEDEEVSIKCGFGSLKKKIVHGYRKIALVQVIAITSEELKKLVIILRLNKPFTLIMRDDCLINLKFCHPDTIITNKDRKLTAVYKIIDVRKSKEIIQDPVGEYKIRIDSIEDVFNNYIAFIFNKDAERLIGQFDNPVTSDPQLVLATAKETLMNLSHFNEEEWQEYLQEEVIEWREDMCTGEAKQLEDHQLQIPNGTKNNLMDMCLYAFSLKEMDSRMFSVESSEDTDLRDVNVFPGRSYLIFCALNDKIVVNCRKNSSKIREKIKIETAFVRIISAHTYDQIRNLPIIIRTHREVTVVIKNQTSARFFVLPPYQKFTEKQLKEVKFENITLKKAEKETKAKGIPFKGIEIEAKISKAKPHVHPQCYYTFLAYECSPKKQSLEEASPEEHLQEVHSLEELSLDQQSLNQPQQIQKPLEQPSSSFSLLRQQRNLPPQIEPEKRIDIEDNMEYFLKDLIKIARKYEYPERGHRIAALPIDLSTQAKTSSKSPQATQSDLKTIDQGTNTFSTQSIEQEHLDIPLFSFHDTEFITSTEEQDAAGNPAYKIDEHYAADNSQEFDQFMKDLGFDD